MDEGGSSGIKPGRHNIKIKKQQGNLPKYILFLPSKSSKGLKSLLEEFMPDLVSLYSSVIKINSFK